MLSDEEVLAIASAHDHARRAVVAIDPVSRTYPKITLDDAYAIQLAWKGVEVARGAIVRGHKVGLTSRSSQAAMKVDSPMSGVLFDFMFAGSGAVLHSDRYLSPRIEVEFAFVLSRPLPSDNISVSDVYAATDYIVPALEIVDSRSYRVHPTDGRVRTVHDTIADNAAAAGVVVGERSARPGAVDLRRCGAILTCNGVVEETGLGASVLGDPVNSVVWLARRLQRLGSPLAEGHTVLAGSFTHPFECVSGDHVEADFGELGSVIVEML